MSDRSPRRTAEPLTLVPPPSATSIESERAVLGSILLNRDAILPLLEFPADAFVLARHQRIFEAIVAMVRDGVPPDLQTVAAELDRRAQLEQCGGRAGLLELLDAASTSFHVLTYADDVRQAALRRSVERWAQRLASAACDPRIPLSTLLQVIEGQGGEAIGRFRGSLHVPVLQSLAELGAEQFAPLVWAIPDLIPEGLTLLAGKPKLGKSWWVLDAALALASGGAAFGSVAIPEPCRVVYLGLEDSKRRLQERTRMVCGCVPDIPFYFATSWPTLDAGGLDRLVAYLDAHGDTRLVVIDTLAKIMPRQTRQQSIYDYEYQAMAGLQRLASERHIAIVGVTHTRKADATDFMDTVTGSTGKTGGVDNVAVLRRVRGEDQGELHIALRDAPSRELAMQFDAVSSRWRLTGDARTVALSANRRLIIELTETDKLYPRDLARLVDMPEASLRRLLREMVAAKQLLQDSDGRYGALVSPDQGDQGDPGRSGRSPDHPGSWRTPIGYGTEGGDA